MSLSVSYTHTHTHTCGLIYRIKGLCIYKTQGMMILSTHGACLTQSSAAPSPIKMALLRMRGRQPGRVTVSCGHLEGGQCRGLDQDLRTPQHICSQNSLCLPPGFPSQPGASLAPPPALLTGPQVHPHPICGLSRSTCTASDDSLRTLPAPCILQDTSLLPTHRCLS